MLIPLRICSLCLPLQINLPWTRHVQFFRVYLYYKPTIDSILLSYSVAFVVHKSLGAMNRMAAPVSQALPYRCSLSLLSSITVVADFLRLNNEQRSDKGNGVVVLDRASCDGSVLKIISDTTQFTPVEKQPTLLRESQLKRLLKTTKDALGPWTGFSASFQTYSFF